MNRRVFFTWISATIAYYLLPEPALAEGKGKFHGRWRNGSKAYAVLQQKGGKVRGSLILRTPRKRFTLTGNAEEDVLVVKDLGKVSRVGKNLVWVDGNGTTHKFAPY